MAFVGPLNDWVRALFERRLPADWRARLGAHLDSWEPEGSGVAPDRRQILKDWIEDCARHRGLVSAEAAQPLLPTAGQWIVNRPEMAACSIVDLDLSRSRFPQRRGRPRASG